MWGISGCSCPPLERGCFQDSEAGVWLSGWKHVCASPGLGPQSHWRWSWAGVACYVPPWQGLPGPERQVTGKAGWGRRWEPPGSFLPSHRAMENSHGASVSCPAEPCSTGTPLTSPPFCGQHPPQINCPEIFKCSVLLRVKKNPTWFDLQGSSTS